MNTIVGVALKLDSLLHLFTIWGLFSKIDFSETVCRRSSYFHSGNKGQKG